MGVDSILEQINVENSGLIKIRMDDMQSNFIKRYIWKFLYLKKIIKDYSVDIIFNPGGALVSKVAPYVTMCRNMLVFETKEANRFGFGVYRFKFWLLRIFQSLSMNKAEGVIFVSNYARNYIRQNFKRINIKNEAIIHHGVSDRFSCDRKEADFIELRDCTKQRPFRFLYVSITDPYKHHVNISKAIVNLSKKGYYVELNVVGDRGVSHQEFENYISKYSFINYLGKVEFSTMQDVYSLSDVFVFGSTCENMPNILLEAMRSGIPIACSNKEPMPEFLQNSGVYFDVFDISSIENALEEYMNNRGLRIEMSNLSVKNAERYSWEKCARETYSFIRRCVK
ncbi:glycosyltransferase family 4 protein [Riemerella anatipestifer]|nr:glycosyltransferase family 4 protein [Riemerella anatipestifer]WPC14224.1 glycosyltransferase family 4 protein [Riemerella anatipestifer]